jgi:hypothetical protein
VTLNDKPSPLALQPTEDFVKPIMAAYSFRFFRILPMVAGTIRRAPCGGQFF